ncbi:transposase [Anatilimnocola floriformis]|uniref:transposase n=1 Tax=Anatilimnocola floriformis TaxID=2948575 RepID=UPI0020C5AB24|nr:transposase [Anatilimnocola floriformis]
MPEFPFQCFDPNQDHTIVWKRLPHWAQAGTICFITWRTADSFPRDLVEKFIARREELLRQLSIDPRGDWRQSIQKLPTAIRERTQWELFANWDEQLDLAAGACVLREPDLSEIVLNSLLHFDNDRYFLTDAVVMPNHVHLLVAFRSEAMLVTQCKSWKRYTATKINRWLRNKNYSTNSGIMPVSASGEFWQVDQFDHLVRSPDEYARYRRYIAENPEKAGLVAGSYRYYSKPISGSITP